MLLLAAVLSGLITDTAGGAIANASVEIVNPAGPATRTDETGHFRFPDLPNPNVQLRIRAFGFATQVRPAAPVIRMEVNALSACCLCEKKPPRYTKKPSATAVLKGNLVAPRLDDNGEATLTPRSGGTPIRLHLAGPGTFEFPNLPPGRYALKITVPTYADFLIDDVNITPKTETTIEGAISLSETKVTRTVFHEKPSPPNSVLCL